MGFLIFLGCAALLAMGILAGRMVLAAVSDGLVAQWRRMTPFGRVAASLAVGACVLYGGGKTRSAKGVPDRDVVRTANWNIRGAWEDSFDLDFAAGWVFPCGTNRLASVEVFSQGYIRPLRSLITPPPSLITHPSSLITNNQPLADLGARVSIIPGVSSFSYEFTPSNSYRFTWNNVTIGRREVNSQQPTTDNNFSLDLFRSGDTLVVSNGVAAYRERVLPFDWDRDGILNEKDERPYIHDGDHFGNDNSLPEGANSNNYCWVEVVVADAAARVTFAGDGPSDYPDPDFVAMPGVAYRVALLIGKTYVVSCEESVSVVDRSSAEITVTSGAAGLTIVWPVTYEVESLARSLSRNIRMLPPQLSGTFSWSTNACCEWVSDGSSSVPQCTDDCTCGGCTLGSFTFHYEGYNLSFGGIACGCEPKPDEDEEDATASISFSSRAIIFENCYTNAPNDIVPRRSTTNCLVISVYGGPYGGEVEIEFDDNGKLEYVGEDVMFPSFHVGPEETVELSYPFIAKEESASENDITASLVFTEYVSGNILESEDEMTAVRVEIETAVYVPFYRTRHILGVGEVVMLKYQPVVNDVEYDPGRGTVLSENSGCMRYDCSHIPCNDRIGIRICDTVYGVKIRVVPPMMYSIDLIKTNSVAQIGQSGGFLAEIYGNVLPLEVSFENVELIELPRVSTNARGYYAQSSKIGLLDHGLHGAGVWEPVQINNAMYDRVAMEINSKPWSDGSFSWPIPNAWRVKGDFGITNIFCNTDQHFKIFVDGKSSVEKFGFKFERLTNGIYTVVSP